MIRSAALKNSLGGRVVVERVESDIDALLRF